jgi:hypothetical protein
MDAQSLEGVRAEGLRRLVLEMNPGWFAGRALGRGPF